MLLGQTPFLQTFPHVESCATFATWSRWRGGMVQRCRPQGPDPSAGRGAHARSKGNDAGGRLGTISPTLGAAAHARSQGLTTAGAVACRWCHAEEAPRPSQRLFAELVTAARGCQPG